MHFPPRFGLIQTIKHQNLILMNWWTRKQPLGWTGKQLSLVSVLHSTSTQNLMELRSCHIDCPCPLLSMNHHLPASPAACLVMEKFTEAKKHKGPVRHFSSVRELPWLGQRRIGIIPFDFTSMQPRSGCGRHVGSLCSPAGVTAHWQGSHSNHFLHSIQKFLQDYKKYPDGSMMIKRKKREKNTLVAISQDCLPCFPVFNIFQMVLGNGTVFAKETCIPNSKHNLKLYMAWLTRRSFPGRKQLLCVTCSQLLQPKYDLAVSFAVCFPDSNLSEVLSQFNTLTKPTRQLP